jgi:hypothetical protein
VENTPHSGFFLFICSLHNASMKKYGMYSFVLFQLLQQNILLGKKENASKMKTGFQMQQHSVETAVSDTAHKKCEANSLYDENRRYR